MPIVSVLDGALPTAAFVAMAAPAAVGGAPCLSTGASSPVSLSNLLFLPEPRPPGPIDAGLGVPARTGGGKYVDDPDIGLYAPPPPLLLKVPEWDKAGERSYPSAERFHSD